MGRSLIQGGRVSKVLLFAVGIFLLCVLDAQATHLRAGEITVTRLNCTSRQFRITVTVYTDTGSGVLLVEHKTILILAMEVIRMVMADREYLFRKHPIAHCLVMDLNLEQHHFQ